MPTISRPCWIPGASASAAAATAPSPCTQPLHRRFTQEAFLNGASGHGVEPDRIAFRVHQDRDENDVIDPQNNLHHRQCEKSDPSSRGRDPGHVENIKGVGKHSARRLAAIPCASIRSGKNLWWDYRAASDSSMIRAHNSGNSIPAARAALGRRLLEVMPGIVLISSTYGWPSSLSMMSTRP